MLYRWRARNLLLILVLLCFTPLIDPARVSALPVTYDLVSGADLEGHFTYDAATLSLIGYEITSAFHSVTWNAAPIDEAFASNGFFIADHAFSGNSVYLLEFVARVDTFTFQGRACLEPLCTY